MSVALVAKFLCDVIHAVIIIWIFWFFLNSWLKCFLSYNFSIFNHPICISGQVQLQNARIWSPQLSASVLPIMWIKSCNCLVLLLATRPMAKAVISSLLASVHANQIMRVPVLFPYWLHDYLQRIKSSIN